MQSRNEAFPARSWLWPLQDAGDYLLDTVAVAKATLLHIMRMRTWFIGMAVQPFMLMAPFIFLANTLYGGNKRLEGGWFGETGYDSSVGYLAVPLIAVALSNGAFSWIGMLMVSEQRSGTLERVLMAMRFPSVLFVGRMLAHASSFVFAIAISIGLAVVWLDLTFHTAPVAAAMVVVLHVLATYGMAFAMSSVFLVFPDGYSVQQMVTRVGLVLLAGATFPLAFYPRWLEIVCRCLPFAWAFDLERRTLLRAESFGEIMPDILILALMTGAYWLFGFYMLRLTLRHAKRTGTLGLF